LTAGDKAENEEQPKTEDKKEEETQPEAADKPDAN